MKHETFPQRQRRRYPSEKQIGRMIEIAKNCGLDVCGFEVSADGSIRILEGRAMTTKAAAPTSDFDRFADQL